MSMFNSLSYATKLVNTGLPRAQAEVHAQELQEVLERECGQYATKADLLAWGSELKAEIKQLEKKTDRLEAKTDRLETKTDRLEAKTDRLETKTDRLETKTDRLETKIDGCIAEFVGLRADFAGLRADVAVLTSSHKFVLWIGGGVATMCLSVFGLMITTLWPSLS